MLYFPFMAGAVLLAAMLVLITNWRLALLALGLVAIFAGVLMSAYVPLPVTLAKILAGVISTSILGLTAWQVNFGQPGVKTALFPANWQRIELPTGFLFRFAAVVMVSVGALYTANQANFVLPGLADWPLHNVAAYGLMALGLLNLGFTETPLLAGFGLLVFLAGFDMFYAALEASLAVVALLAAVQFGVALAVSYLTLIQSPRPNPTPPEQP